MQHYHHFQFGATRYSARSRPATHGQDMPGGECEGPFAGNFGPIRERLVRGGGVTSGLPHGACESHECALKPPFAELRLHVQRRRLLSSSYVALWHKAEVRGCYILGPVNAA